MLFLDRHLIFLLNQDWTNPVFDRFLAILSCMEFWFPLFALGAVALVWKGGIRGSACVVMCALGVLINEQVVSQPIKTWTGRPRPHQVIEGLRRVDLAPAKPRLLAAFKPVSVGFSPPPAEPSPRGRSFPSAHTLNAVTLGLALGFFLNSRAWFILPFLMAWSRVYTGAHWPTDVLSSLAIGSCVTLSFVGFSEWAWRRWIPKLRPQWAERHPTLVFPLRPLGSEGTTPSNAFSL